VAVGTGEWTKPPGFDRFAGANLDSRRLARSASREGRGSGKSRAYPTLSASYSNKPLKSWAFCFPRWANPCAVPNNSLRTPCRVKSRAHVMSLLLEQRQVRTVVSCEPGTRRVRLNRATAPASANESSGRSQRVI